MNPQDEECNAGSDGESGHHSNTDTEAGQSCPKGHNSDGSPVHSGSPEPGEVDNSEPSIGGSSAEPEGEEEEEPPLGGAEGDGGQMEEHGGLAPVLTQNQMELLELEMRARAIKAMLKAHEVREKRLEEG